MAFLGLGQLVVFECMLALYSILGPGMVGRVRTCYIRQSARKSIKVHNCDGLKRIKYFRLCTSTTGWTVRLGSGRAPSHER